MNVAADCAVTLQNVKSHAISSACLVFLALQTACRREATLTFGIECKKSVSTFSFVVKENPEPLFGAFTHATSQTNAKCRPPRRLHPSWPFPQFPRAASSLATLPPSRPLVVVVPFVAVASTFPFPLILVRSIARLFRFCSAPCSSKISDAFA